MRLKVLKNFNENRNNSFLPPPQLPPVSPGRNIFIPEVPSFEPNFEQNFHVDRNLQNIHGSEVLRQIDRVLGKQELIRQLPRKIKMDDVSILIKAPKF